jgi:hypothetical protein
MAFKLSPVLNEQQFSDAGILLSGGKIEIYLAGSSTPATTYTSPSGTVAQSNPIILNTRGEVDNLIYLTTGISYKLVLKDSLNNVLRTYDNIEGVNDSSLTIDQWVNSGVTPAFVSATQFTLSGDQTSIFTVGRRLKFLVTAGTVYGTVFTSVFGALTTVTVVMDSLPLDSGLSSVLLGLITPQNTSFPSNALVGTPTQRQSYTAFTTGGTSAAFTLTPSPAITANATNTRFNITLNAAPTGSPTLAVSGQTAKNLKYYDSTGAKQFITSAVAPINWNSDVIDDGTDWVMMDVLPALITNKIQPITAAVAANALTLTLNPTTLDFRSTTPGSGTITTVTNAAAITLTISSGSTLGSINAVATRLAILAINNAGTMELAAINLAGQNQLDEVNIINTVAEGGAGGADSNNVFYSTTSRTGVAYRVVGFVEYTQATAGTYATAPSIIQGIGGQALAALSSLGNGQTWQSIARISGTTYYNTTGKPIQLYVNWSGASASGNINIGGTTMAATNGGAGGAIAPLFVIVPVSQSYIITTTTGVLGNTFELR